jgi:glycosyltransferase involved in cell wall biosynthesis
MTKLNIPVGTNWELIIVDNGSTDSTREVVDSFRGLLPIKWVFQPEPGVSNARNFGINIAKGEYFIWTDDDVLVEPSWLAAYLGAFRRWPNAAVFGGKIIPVLQPPTPIWFQNAINDLRDLVGFRDFGPDPIPLSIKGERLPFGANFAIRATEQKQNHYDKELGIGPGRNIGGEETTVIKTILGDNNSGWWIPGAEVKHIIPNSRQTTEYIFQYYEGAGKAMAYSIIKDTPTTRLSIPLGISVKLPIAFALFYLAYWFRSKFWVRYLSSYAHQHGRFKYWLASINGEK